MKNLIVLTLAVCFSQIVCGQPEKSDKPVTIKGKVLNQKEYPVMGAAIYIDNIRTSASTGQDGSYKIKVSPNAENLEVRSSQYGSCIASIKGHTIINFVLDGDKGIASYSDGDEKPAKSKSRKMNTYNDIYQMIRAEVPGVTVSGRSIQIRQGHSFLGSSTPLFVVNGVIVQSIDNVNPMEVKSIGLLRGPSAAIYGVNGSNGVISITLKNGTEKD